MRRRLAIGSMVLGLAAACASGAAIEEDNGPALGSTGGTDTGGAGAGGDACGLCASPPEPSCSSDCTSTVYEMNGTCEGTTCTYGSHVEDCKFGCDAQSGACRAPNEPGDACADVMCGDKNACGGTCDSASGCCFKEPYQKSTGYAYSGAMVCCDGNDVRLGHQDCGDGDDHWADAANPNCAIAYEGSENYGSPCAQVSCERIVCTSGEGGSGGSGGQPNPN